MPGETLTIPLPDDIASRLSTMPATEQERVREEIGAFAVAVVRGREKNIHYTRKELLAMSREQRESIMRAQAAAAVAFYEANRIRPASEYKP